MILNSLVIKVINLILEANTGSRSLLMKHKDVAFKILVPGFSISAQIDIDGYLANTNNLDFNVVINIPLDSATFLIDQDKLSVYKKISFEGDTNLGREILEIFAELHIDNIYNKINNPGMLFILNRLLGVFRDLSQYIRLVGNNTIDTVKEYLTYETEDLITKFEHDKFCNEVDKISQRTSYLEEQIRLLNSKKATIQ